MGPNLPLGEMVWNCSDSGYLFYFSFYILIRKLDLLKFIYKYYEYPVYNNLYTNTKSVIRLLLVIFLKV
jgi:hypothetical protein